MKFKIYFLLLILIINNNLFLFFKKTKHFINGNENYKCKNIENILNIYRFKKENFKKMDNKIFNLKIKIATYIPSLNNGGVERNTALLLNYLSQIEIFELYLFNSKRSNNEYKISGNIRRFFIFYGRKNLKRILLKNKINIFIFQSYEETIIAMLKKMKNIKIIFYNHSCFLFWIYYQHKTIFKTMYNGFKNIKYLISIIPFENDYLFKKWGINSIFMNNFLTFDYNKVIQSDLSSKTILMIGRGNDKNKRFELGIYSMKYIIKEIPESKMIIISSIKGLQNLKDLTNILNLKEYIYFSGYTNNPEIFFKNSSLHIFPTISEAFPMVLSETKIYGIPSILLGIDYVSTSKEGNIIIYDDNPEIVGKYAIEILINDKYRKDLGKKGRISMKKFSNQILFKKWVKLILSINKGEDCFENFKNNHKSLNENESIKILKNQVKLLKKRLPIFINLTLNNIIFR